MRIHLLVRTLDSAKECKVCQDIIKKQELAIINQYYNRFYFFHLKCYTPSLKQYIYLQDLRICRDDSENNRIFNSWLVDWDKKYSPIDEAEIDIPLSSKFKYSESPKYRRAWLEIFKFLDVKEMATIIAHVNKNFYLFTYDEELWQFYCLRDYGEIELIKINYREQYIFNAMYTCFWCGENANEKNLIDLFDKAVCEKCEESDELDKLNKRQIERDYGVNPNILQLKFIKDFMTQIWPIDIW